MSVQHKETSVLCYRCQDIDFGIVLKLESTTLRDKWKHGFLIAKINADNIRESQPNNCQLCWLFGLMRNTAARPLSEDWELRAYSSIQGHGYNVVQRLPAALRAKDIPRLALVPSSSTHLDSLKPPVSQLYCIPSGYQYERIFMPTPTDQKVNYQIIRTWIEICKEKHRTLCYPRPNETPGLKVIDCSSTCSQLAIVSAPPGHAYIALSYVWGVPQKQTRGDNSDRVSKSSYNSDYQAVIGDAKAVVLQLGYQYLWVDKYCINQENDTEKEFFVNSMDKIYSGAELTIVAAAGIDGDFGLPGVGSSQRKVQPTIQLSNVQLISCMEHPRTSIMFSKWATRAWTHQEALLSQRLLFFTEFETYYECHSMQCRESISADWGSLHCKQGKIYAGLNHGLFLGKVSSSLSSYGSSFQGLDRFYEQVCQYTSREMSYESDSLRAFIGIMKRFRQDKIPIFQLWGIPFLTLMDKSDDIDKSFIAGLMWSHCLNFRSKPQGPKRRTPFPSWAWCGWRGQVNFSVRSIAFYKGLTNRVIDLRLDNHDKGDLPLNSLLVKDCLLSPSVLVCRVFVLQPHSFLLRFNRGTTTNCKLCSTLHPPNGTTEPFRIIRPPIKKGCKPRSQARRYPGTTAQLNLCKGPKILTRLPEYLKSNHIKVILLATSNACGGRKLPVSFFLLVEPVGEVFERIGLLSVNASWEALCSDYQFLDEQICIQ